MGDHGSTPDPEEPRSLWHRTGPDIGTDVELPSVADVVVVGAGLTGLAAATLLARAGSSVVVLEARRVGAVTTGGTTGKLSLLQGTVLSGIRDQNDDEVLRRYVDANRAAQEWLVAEVAATAGAIESRAAITYATSVEGDETLRREREASETAGLPIDVLTGEQASGLGLPFAVTSALRLSAQYQLHPMRVLARLVDAVRAAGGSVVEGQRVTDVDIEDHGVRVHAGDRTVRARAVVLATGTPVLDRGLFFAKLEPSRSLAAAYRLADGVTAPEGMFVSIDEPARSLRTAEDGDGPLLIVGGEPGFPGRAPSVRRRLAELDEWTDEWFAPAARTAWWAAQDYRTFTRLPFAAALPRGGGRIYAATGYAKWGMTNAVAAAHAITGTITGADDTESVFSSHPGLKAVGEALGANAEVSRRLVVGWAKPDADLPDDEPGRGRIVRSGAKPVAESTIDGATCRLSGICTHLGGVLAWNDAESSWDCPLHGSRFSASGAVLEGPAVRDLAPVE